MPEPYFHKSLDLVNKIVADNLVYGGLMKQTFTRATELLDEIIKVYRAWYTRDDMAILLTLRLTKEKINKNQERDGNMAKMVMQLDLFTKHVTGVPKMANSIRTNENLLQKDVVYEKDIQFLYKMGAYCPNFKI